MSTLEALLALDAEITALQARREQLFAAAGERAGILRVDWMSDQLSVGDEGGLLTDFFHDTAGVCHSRVRLMWRRDDWWDDVWSVRAGDWGIALWQGRFRVVARADDGRGIAVRADDGEVPEYAHRLMVAKLRRDLHRSGLRARVRDHDVAIVTPTGDELLRGDVFDAFRWLFGVPEATVVEA